MAKRYGLIALAYFLIAGCTTLPDDIERTTSTAFAEPTITSLGRESARFTSANAGLSGIVLLDTGREAFTHRVAMIEAAERAIDIQYYIWDADRSGKNIAARMLRAADRGVRVRVLLDDLGIGAKDPVLFALDTHPGIEIRLYNPLPAGNRSGVRRLMGIVSDFDRLAPRMHSKLMLVDGSAFIVGGRNIADDYFDLGETRNFRDRDVLLVGPLVARSGEAFDSAWASWSSFPIAAVAQVHPDTQEVSAVLEALRGLDVTAASPISASRSAVEGRAFFAQALRDATWAEAELIHNRPLAKGEIASFDNPGAIARRLVELVDNTQRGLLIESGYVISGRPALDIYARLAERGVRVQILTNSLASNDVVALHAGYSRSRPALLERDVELHELRPDAASCLQLVGAAERCSPSARLALHSKTAVFDDSIVYVGSYNFNPRSAYLNTEFAVIIHSSVFAERIVDHIAVNLEAENSWKVEADVNGALRWSGDNGEVDSVQYSEPQTSIWTRLKSSLIALLPIEQYY